MTFQTPNHHCLPMCLQAHSNYKTERHLIGTWFCQLGNFMTLPTIPFLTVSSQLVPSQTVTSLSAISDPVTSSNSPSISPDAEPIEPVAPEKHLKNLKLKMKCIQLNWISTIDLFQAKVRHCLTLKI